LKKFFWRIFGNVVEEVLSIGSSEKKERKTKDLNPNCKAYSYLIPKVVQKAAWCNE